jgi:hypothetical protein
MNDDEANDPRTCSSRLNIQTIQKLGDEKGVTQN